MNTEKENNIQTIQSSITMTVLLDFFFDVIWNPFYGLHGLSELEPLLGNQWG